MFNYFSNSQRENDPPVHTNGIVVREITVRHVKYRFQDTSGYFSHYDDWEEAVNQSDGILAVCDSTGMEDGEFFTKDFFEKIQVLLSKKKVPSYILLNKTKEGESLEPLKQMIDTYMVGIPTAMGKIGKLNDDIYKVFDWFESHVVLATKKK